MRKQLQSTLHVVRNEQLQFKGDDRLRKSRLAGWTVIACCAGGAFLWLLSSIH